MLSIFLYFYINLEAGFDYGTMLKSQKSKDNLRKNKQKTDSKKNPVQRRNYFRLVCSVPASLKTITRSDTGRIIQGPPHETTICNISGGGVRLLASFPLEQDEKILLTFKLLDEILILTGDVRIVYYNPEAELPYQFGVMFTGLSDKDQDKIFKYIYQEQTFLILSR